MFRKGRRSSVALALAVVMAACSNSDSPTEPAAPEAPAKPVIVSVTEQNGALIITWNAVSGAEAYNVERQEVASGASFTGIASGVTGTSYTDENVETGKSYNYRVLAVNAGGASSPSDPVPGTVGRKAAVLSGTISGIRTLSADTVYTITGIVIVDEGAELHIPAGTLLHGSVSVQPSALIVRQGGKLFSEGTAEAPVVFTSENPEGSRRRGDWGGVVLNGRSLCNFPAGECVGEGASGPYGGDVLDDNSGRVTYTRIEYAGFEVSFGNELNALTLNGVGSGTEIHHVQVHYGSDDGVELFGGTVDLKYILATGNSDDSFDYSTGWQGRAQFLLVQQDPDDADNGFEVDGNEEDYDAEPFTDPRIYNVTLIGKGLNGEGGTAGESTRGMLQRRGTAGKIYNAVIMGFGSEGIDIDNAETVGRFELHNSYIFGNAKPFSTDEDGIDEEAIVRTADWQNVIGTDPLLTDPFNRDAPDFRPQSGSPLLAGFASPPNDGFFSPVTYIGAIGPDETPWYAGWTTTARN
ncbi:MAG: fibronectin type III domain-containing protein [Gemmatimonadota bacterium]